MSRLHETALATPLPVRPTIPSLSSLLVFLMSVCEVTYSGSAFISRRRDGDVNLFQQSDKCEGLSYTYNRGIFLHFFLLHLPPLRFHCVGGC